MLLIPCRLRHSPYALSPSDYYGVERVSRRLHRHRFGPSVRECGGVRVELIFRGAYPTDRSNWLVLTRLYSGWPDRPPPPAPPRAQRESFGSAVEGVVLRPPTSESDFRLPSQAAQHPSSIRSSKLQRATTGFGLGSSSEGKEAAPCSRLLTCHIQAYYSELPRQCICMPPTAEVLACGLSEFDLKRL